MTESASSPLWLGRSRLNELATSFEMESGDCADFGPGPVSDSVAALQNLAASRGAPELAARSWSAGGLTSSDRARGFWTSVDAPRIPPETVSCTRILRNVAESMDFEGEPVKLHRRMGPPRFVETTFDVMI